MFTSSGQFFNNSQVDNRSLLAGCGHFRLGLLKYRKKRASIFYLKKKKNCLFFCRYGQVRSKVLRLYCQQAVVPMLQVSLLLHITSSQQDSSLLKPLEEVSQLFSAPVRTSRQYSIILCLQCDCM